MTYALIVVIFGCSNAYGETKTLSWDPVLTYTDNTPITSQITYDAWWSISNTFVTPHYVLTNATPTSVVFDVMTQGMVRGTTIYFSARTRTALGEVSVDAPPYAWIVPAAPSMVPIAPSGKVGVRR